MALSAIEGVSQWGVVGCSGGRTHCTDLSVSWIFSRSYLPQIFCLGKSRDFNLIFSTHTRIFILLGKQTIANWANATVYCTVFLCIQEANSNFNFNFISAVSLVLIYWIILAQPSPCLPRVNSYSRVLGCLFKLYRLYHTRAFIHQIDCVNAEEAKLMSFCLQSQNYLLPK